jgi:cytochrome P450
MLLLLVCDEKFFELGRRNTDDAGRLARSARTRKTWLSSFSFLHVPFSKGSRDCIGKYFAMLELKIALAALICRYDGGVVNQDEVYTTRLTSIHVGGAR